MVKPLLLFLCMWIAAGSLMGQEIDSVKQRHLIVGLGWSLQKVQDDGMSPLQYRGSAGSFLLGYNKSSGKLLQMIDLHIHFGSLRNRFAPEISSGQAYVLRIDADYAYLPLIRKLGTKGTALFAGGTFSSVTNNRYHNLLNNSSFNYGGYNSIGIGAALQHEVKHWNRRFLLRYRINLPLLSYVTRPNYVTLFEYTDPDYNGLKDLMNNSDFYTWNRFFRVNMRTELSYVLKNNNQVKLGYIWDYYSYTKLNPVEAAAHYVQISTLFHF